ncbi:MAG: hypothetical protein NZ901_08275 [Geminocystis sp.]|nr:hypothetical protein [Geminocystis sp.]HIK37645.1 hypothetical protein [Geminocystis sp. M7585_C2015_104]MCS7148169.1 hypothetical protein [Geminocystis sp.]MCX8078122.1 hypothetical protein [Geminocystis sp.]MDW8116520.1 hypothetical protein [Geminocystis sp.]
MQEIINSLLAGGFYIAQIKDPDVIGQIVSAWQNFVQSGQIWALLIGMFLGYTFASFTRF